MKKQLVLILLLALYIPTTAQYKREDIFRNAPLTWLGLDFSRVKIEGYNYPTSQYKEIYFPVWNEMARNKEDNLDLESYLHRDKVEISIDEVNRINATIDRNILTPASVDRDTLEKVLQSYNLPKKNGIGVIVFVSDIVHKGELLYGKMAFVDLQTGRLLLVKKIEGDGKGFGFRNTWANAIRSSLKFAKRKWDNWERQVKEADKTES